MNRIIVFHEVFSGIRGRVKVVSLVQYDENDNRWYFVDTQKKVELLRAVHNLEGVPHVRMPFRISDI